MRHGVGAQALHVAATAAYVLAKWAATPFLYTVRRAGWRGTWPRRLDAAVNLTCLPLTERPDDRERRDVVPTITPGEVIPDIQILMRDGMWRSLRSFAGRPLLLALIRGSWCSYSRLHLADLNAFAPRLAAAGVQVVAVTTHADAAWWEHHGVTIPVAADPSGAVFQALGVGVHSWIDTAWGRVLPHESVFLFDAASRLVAADVRQVSSITPGQTFLSGERWIQIATTSARSR